MAIKLNNQLFLPGPIRTEARRLAKEMIRQNLAKQGKRLDQQSERETENGITVLLYNAQEYFLKQAKFNVEERK